VRLDLARQVGATGVLLSDDALSTQLLELTNGEGVDVALEAVGRKETVAAAIDSVRKGGTVVPDRQHRAASDFASTKSGYEANSPARFMCILRRISARD